MIDERLPNFLVIGAGKSGTTSLDKYLGQHPEIFMATKEPSYFAIKSLESINNPLDTQMLNHYPNGVQNLEEYLNLFRHADTNQIKGETSPIYLNSEIAPDEISRLIPEIKLIAILRHPAERLYSRYLHLANEFREPDLNLLFDENSLWHSRNDLLKEGFYAKNLSRYYNVFNKSQIKVFLYEDFRKNPVETMSTIYDFLDVDPNFKADMRVKYNQAGFVKRKWLEKLYGRDGYINRTIKSINPRLYSNLKSNRLAYQLLNKVRSKNIDRTQMSLDLKREIVDRIYVEDIANLEKVLDRDLESWYTF